jgi:L-amino acid N-acyltransferase YncA
MTPFRAHRATAPDVDALRKLIAEATGQRSTLYGSRRDRLDPAEWLAAHAPVVVVSAGTEALGFAAALAQNVPNGTPKCAEVMVFVTSARRRGGVARAAMSELLTVARTMGLWKLLAYALPEDPAGKALMARLDFREVGVMVKHAQLEGGWHDVAMYERLVMAARKSFPSFGDG